MRYSKQRDAIIRIVQNTSCHPTADWVYEQARKKMPNISLGTIYRNLGQLVDNNMLQSFKIDQVVHYDGKIEDHLHFFCKKCNQVYDVEIPLQEIISSIEKKVNHKVSDYHIHLIGICETCQPNKH